MVTKITFLNKPWYLVNSVFGLSNASSIVTASVLGLSLNIGLSNDKNANIIYLIIVYIFNRITTRNNRPDYSHFTGDLVYIMPKLSSLNLESIYIRNVIVI